MTHPAPVSAENTEIAGSAEIHQVLLLAGETVGEAPVGRVGEVDPLAAGNLEPALVDVRPNRLVATFEQPVLVAAIRNRIRIHRPVVVEEQPPHHEIAWHAEQRVHVVADPIRSRAFRCGVHHEEPASRVLAVGQTVVVVRDKGAERLRDDMARATDSIRAREAKHLGVRAMMVEEPLQRVGAVHIGRPAELRGGYRAGLVWQGVELHAADGLEDMVCGRFRGHLVTITRRRDPEGLPCRHSRRVPAPGIGKRLVRDERVDRGETGRPAPLNGRHRRGGHLVFDDHAVLIQQNVFEPVCDLHPVGSGQQVTVLKIPVRIRNRRVRDRISQVRIAENRGESVGPRVVDGAPRALDRRGIRLFRALRVRMIEKTHEAAPCASRQQGIGLPVQMSFMV
ncbi:hypothetical protein [Maritimibacter sp. UBA3975]|uniref:hypothetical protein n=1 Tax=Maritimibacter sp. UBA3975 TaxID=1946833 RepID=UPI0025B94B33|nr:hypothetical protein [Maritimibacter sp. UBA3975]